MSNLNMFEWEYANGSYYRMLIRYNIQTNNPAINLPEASKIVEKKKTKPEIVIHPSKENFCFGNCASTAIASAFKIEFKALKLICSLLKIDVDNGMSFFECKKLINLIGENYGIYVTYTPNYGKVTYEQMLFLLNKGKYIAMFDEHLSYSENGEIYDSYFRPPWGNDIKKEKPTGWWKIGY